MSCIKKLVIDIKLELIKLRGHGGARTKLHQKVTCCTITSIFNAALLNTVYRFINMQASCILSAHMRL